MVADPLRGGPHNLGDPDDRRLRHVEKEVLIPVKIRDRAKEEKCSSEVQAFTECCKKSGMSMVFKCRSENSSLKSCLAKWYNDDKFKQECAEEYLKERAEYRRTGVAAEKRKKHTSSF